MAPAPNNAAAVAVSLIKESRLKDFISVIRHPRRWRHRSAPTIAPAK
jgi:hypothetical protein